MVNEKKYNFVYKTTFFDGEYYIGKRSTNKLNDGYYGSGNRVDDKIKKYKRQGLKINEICHREILEFAENEEQAYVLEEKYVTPEVLDDPLCLNLCKGGLGGVGNNESWNKGKPGTVKGKRLMHIDNYQEYVPVDEIEQREKEGWKLGASDIFKKMRSETQKGKTPTNKGKKGVQSAWNKGKKGVQSAWNKGLTKETDERVRHISKSVSKATLGRTPWNKNKKGVQTSPMKGKHHTEQAKEKNRQAHLGKTAWNKGMTKQEMDEYQKTKISHNE